MKKIIPILLFIVACATEDPMPNGTWKLDKAIFTVISADTLINEGIFYDSVFTESFMFIDQGQVRLDNFPLMLPSGEELIYRLTLPPPNDLPYTTPLENLKADMLPKFLSDHYCDSSVVEMNIISIEKHNFNIIERNNRKMHLSEDVTYYLRIKYPPPPCQACPPNGRISADPREINVRIEYLLNQ